MKKISILLTIFAIHFTQNFSFAQNVNWRAFNDKQNNLINLNFGWDNASVIGIGYGYKLKTTRPLMLEAEFSIPFGNEIFDDHKLKLGAQSEIVRLGNFSGTVKAFGIIRRYQNDLTRLVNFGSEFSGVLGYYKSTWNVGAEFGFDKAIVTHVKHSSIMHEFNPSVENGWYIPTGGNFFYGLQAGYSFSSMDICLKLGKTKAQDFKSSSAIPLYFQIGLNKKF